MNITHLQSLENLHSSCKRDTSDVQSKLQQVSFRKHLLLMAQSIQSNIVIILLIAGLIISSGSMHTLSAQCNCPAGYTEITTSQTLTDPFPFNNYCVTGSAVVTITGSTGGTWKLYACEDADVTVDVSANSFEYEATGNAVITLDNPSGNTMLVTAHDNSNIDITGTGSSVNGLTAYLSDNAEFSIDNFSANNTNIFAQDNTTVNLDEFSMNCFGADVSPGATLNQTATASLSFNSYKLFNQGTVILDLNGLSGNTMNLVTSPSGSTTYGNSGSISGNTIMSTSHTTFNNQASDFTIDDNYSGYNTLYCSALSSNLSPNSEDCSDGIDNDWDGDVDDNDSDCSCSADGLTPVLTLPPGN